MDKVMSRSSGTKIVSLNKKWKEVLYAFSGFGPNFLMVLMGVIIAMLLILRRWEAEEVKLDKSLLDFVLSILFYFQF